MKQSHLYETHIKHRATPIEQTGWDVPAHYGDPDGEHLAVRKNVGILDLSHRGKLRITGDDRIKWLQGIISNDILPLAPGQGIHSGFLNHKGKMLSYFRVYQLGDALMIEDVGEIGETTYSALRKFLLYGTKAKLENCAETWGLLLVSGPKAPDLIKAAFAKDVSGLKPLTFLTHEIEGQQALLIRTEETGEFDLEVMVPASALTKTWEQIWTAGQTMGLKAFGIQALESLRIEAGLPKAGPDINEEIVPPEANLEGKAFSLSKGCYPGQEVVARMETYGSVRRRLVGLIVQGETVPPHGTKIFSGDREVGWISSAVRSPSLGKVIAFGFPLRDFAKPATELAVEINSQRIPAVVSSLPFVAHP